jgi:hypothetical protein
MKPERLKGKHKEKGHTQKPYLNQSIGPALVELAKRITVAEPIEIQKAASYIYELGLYIQSDDYKERRERHNSSTRKSRQTRKSTQES